MDFFSSHECSHFDFLLFLIFASTNKFFGAMSVCLQKAALKKIFFPKTEGLVAMTLHAKQWLFILGVAISVHQLQAAAPLEENCEIIKMPTLGGKQLQVACFWFENDYLEVIDRYYGLTWRVNLLSKKSLGSRKFTLKWKLPHSHVPFFDQQGHALWHAETDKFDPNNFSLFEDPTYRSKIRVFKKQNPESKESACSIDTELLK